MNHWRWMASGLVITVFFIGFLVLRTRQRSFAEELTLALAQSGSSIPNPSIEFDSLTSLPPPVARYFRRVLEEGKPRITRVHMRQRGQLRTSPRNTRWISFTATQLVVPPATGFMWDAKVGLPLWTHVRVLDGYVNGSGLGRVSIMSAWPVTAKAALPELNSGALHRYLAEAVWFPTALLPEAGVVWSPMGERSALATLTDRGTTVALEFRFNDEGEVTSVYSPGRFGYFDGSYQRVPWEGHFRDYQEHDGVRVPCYGEVGWYVEEKLELVWRGNIIDLHYQDAKDWETR